MAEHVHNFPYVILGAGTAGGSAVEGIREVDADSPILLIGDEPHRPYERPPLSKKLWGGKMKLEKVFMQPEGYYAERGVDLLQGAIALDLDPVARRVSLADGREFGYKKLLLATGGRPKRLGLLYGEPPGLYYYRYLDDYLALEPRAVPGTRAVVIGGGFIGSEIAAALNKRGVEVTLIFPGEYLVHRVFPRGLGEALGRHYVEKGVRLLSGDTPTAITRAGEGFTVETRGGERLEADLVVVGVGIALEMALPAQAGVTINDGVEVNEYLQTSVPGIYAAGDLARFTYAGLDTRMRVEHWDHALNSGRYAGRNLAGAGQPYDYMPYFYSDLFEFGYEAVGEIDPRLDVVADWREENATGVLYFLREGKLRGAMMCNVWDQVPAARELIRSGRTFAAADLQGAIG